MIRIARAIGVDGAGRTIDDGPGREIQFLDPVAGPQHALVQRHHRAIFRHVEFNVLGGVALPAQHRLVARAAQQDATRMTPAQRVGLAVVFAVQVTLRARGLHAVHGHGLRKFGFDVGFQLALILQLQARAGGHDNARHRRRRLQRDVAGSLAAVAFTLDLPNHDLHPTIEGKRHRQHHEHQAGSLPVPADGAPRPLAGNQHQRPAKQHQAGEESQGKEDVEARGG
ncbi:hypothetical protein WJ966_15420 [Achromobacter xylosoxidans]